MGFIKSAFAVIAFGIVMMIAFPMVNDMFTAPDGIMNIVGNTTSGTPYESFENLIWKNWHYIIFAAAGIGFVTWLLKENEIM